MPGVGLDVFDSVTRLLQRQLPRLEAVYLFGTAARGQVRADSDIDLAVLAGTVIPPEVRFALEQQCAVMLRRDVDLVDLHHCPLTLAAHAVGEGRRLFHAHDFNAAAFENSVLSRYCAFNEERRPLLEAIRQRGAIHA
jgi:uncharacterized protein